MHVSSWGAGVGVVLTTVSGALANELNGGWQWRVACAGFVLVSAGVAMWLASSTEALAARRTKVGTGAVFAGRTMKIGGSVRISRQPAEATPPSVGGSEPAWEVGPGTVAAGRDLEVNGDVETNAACLPADLPQAR